MNEDQPLSAGSVYGNDAGTSAGCIIAFHLHRADLSTGDIGVLCSFGAGYSIGSLVIVKL